MTKQNPKKTKLPIDILNWYISPHTHTLTGDIPLKEYDQLIEQYRLRKGIQYSHASYIDIRSQKAYRFSNLGNIEYSKKDGDNYIVGDSKKKEYLIKWENMDKYFFDRFLKFTKNHLDEILT
jgi:hypothetical protein